jgi:hypothetical protein
MRYLIELVVPLLVLVPLLMARLPIVVGMLYLAVVSGFMLADAYQTLQQNEQRPLSRVTVVPREDQYPTFVAPESFTYFEGARMLDRKYPADEWPQIYVVRAGATPWAGLDYPFLDPQARRRVTYWFDNLDTDRPAWPGPFLVLAPDVAEILDSRFGEQVVLDRLSDQVWLGLPRDQLRLIWTVEAADGTKPSVVRLRAVHNPDRYRQPQFRFSTIDMRSGALVSVLRGFARDARFTLPSTSLSRVLYLQVEVRESGSSSTDEQLRVPERRMLER